MDSSLDKVDTADFMVFWDYENVPVGPKSNELNNLVAYINELGTPLITNTYADWSIDRYSTITPKLFMQGFELIHIPEPVKNSIDMKLACDVEEITNLFPRVKKIILILGDRDYRSLILKLQKRGIQIVLIGRLKSMNYDLMDIVDEHIDISSLPTPDSPYYQIRTGPIYTKIKSQIESAFAQLQWAVKEIENSEKPAQLELTQKTIRLLNPGFSYSKFGFKKFSDFTKEADTQGYIVYKEPKWKSILSMPSSDSFLSEYLNNLNISYSELRPALRLCSRKGDSPTPMNIFESFSDPQSKPKISELGYDKYMDYLRGAAYLGIVTLQKNDIHGILVLPVIEDSEVTEWLKKKGRKHLALSDDLDLNLLARRISKALFYHATDINTLEYYLTNERILPIYQLVLTTNKVEKLPAYAKCLFHLLYASDLSLSETISTINNEIQALGMRLVIPENITDLGKKYLETLVPSIFSDSQDSDKIEFQFLNLPLEKIQLIQTRCLNTWELEYIQELLVKWWERNLNSLEDALRLLKFISQERKSKSYEYLTIKSHFENETKRLVGWLVEASDSDKEAFLKEILHMNFDIIRSGLDNTFIPIIKNIKRNTEFNKLLFFNHYRYIGFLLEIWTEKEWSSFIDDISLESISEYETLSKIWIQTRDNASNESVLILIDTMLTQYELNGVELHHLPDGFKSIINLMKEKSAYEKEVFIREVIKRGISLIHTGLTQLLDKDTLVSNKSEDLYQLVLERVKNNIEHVVLFHDTEFVILFDLLKEEDRLKLLRDTIENHRETFSHNVVMKLLNLGTDKDYELIAREINRIPSLLVDLYEMNPKKTLMIQKYTTTECAKGLFDLLSLSESEISELDLTTTKKIIKNCLSYPYPPWPTHLLLKTSVVDEELIDLVRSASWDSENLLYILLQSMNEKFAAFIGELLDKTIIDCKHSSVVPFGFPQFKGRGYYHFVLDILKHMKNREAIYCVIYAVSFRIQSLEITLDDLLQLADKYSLSRKQKYILQGRTLEY
ncbi:MAG: NYN domain-containing protein [Candidatus Thorarchaeota archaeon]